MCRIAQEIRNKPHALFGGTLMAVAPVVENIQAKVHIRRFS
jgi:hypothetical protein